MGSKKEEKRYTDLTDKIIKDLEEAEESFKKMSPEEQASILKSRANFYERERPLMENPEGYLRNVMIFKK